MQSVNSIFAPALRFLTVRGQMRSEVETHCPDNLLVALPEELGPVADGPSEKASEDKVKLGRVVPRLLYIVYIERNVRWDAAK
jgi:hypothetical protein